VVFSGGDVDVDIPEVDVDTDLPDVDVDPGDAPDVDVGEAPDN
jgi:hypothetical protein